MKFQDSKPEIEAPDFGMKFQDSKPEIEAPDSKLEIEAPKSKTYILHCKMFLFKNFEMKF